MPKRWALLLVRLRPSYSEVRHLDEIAANPANILLSDESSVICGSYCLIFDTYQQVKGKP
jgi:hypothetical protein